MDPELADALADVRRATRLLWGYQRRLLDTVALIADAFPEHEFYAWRPSVGSPPPQLTGDPLRRWAWDFMPLTECSILFLPAGSDRNAPRAGEWMLEVLVQTDDGHDEHAGDAEPDADAFAPVEECASSVSLYAWYCDEPVERNWFHWVWERGGDYPEEDDRPVEHPEGGFRIVGRTINLEELPDRAAIRARAESFRGMLVETFGLAA